MNKLNKVKAWYKENEDEVKVCILLTSVAALAYGLGKLKTMIEVDAGIRYGLDKGVFKIIHHSTGAEAKNYTEAVEFVRDFAKTLKK